MFKGWSPAAPLRGQDLSLAALLLQLSQELEEGEGCSGHPWPAARGRTEISSEPAIQQCSASGDTLLPWDSPQLSPEDATDSKC